MSTKNDTTSVQFLPVEIAPGYEVSGDGRVWCTHNTRRKPCPRREIKGTITKKGYVRVFLQRGPNQPFQKMVHDLVLTAFVSPRPPGMEGCHWDGNKQNNHLGNLRWDTPKGNKSDSRRLGEFADLRGSKNPRARLDEEIVAEIKRAIRGGATRMAIQRQFRLTKNQRDKIYYGTAWQHVA